MKTSILCVRSAMLAGLAGAALLIPAGASAQSRGVTYTKDVAPILYKACVECHRPSMFAPMSLLTYEETRPWARAIRSRVIKREMPPWTAEGPHGVFKNDPRLTDEEIATIARWVDAGAPRGDERDLPPPPTFAEGWSIGTPDQVFRMTEAFEVPAEGAIPYQHIRVPTHLTEDKWIQAIEFKPGDRRVVHHIIANAQPVGHGTRDERTPGRVSLGGITPNTPGVVFPPGVARRLPANSELILEVHYTTIGEPTTDTTEVGVIYADEPPKQLLAGAMILNAAFSIPPGAPAHEVTASRTLQEDTLLVAMMPHMHMRGKSMKYTAVYPDGRTEVLLDVPQYLFNWQIDYELAEPKRLPKGTRIEVVARFDNSTGNPYNPDATATVRWGEQTWEEMMIGFITTLVDRPVEQTTAASAAP